MVRLGLKIFVTHIIDYSVNLEGLLKKSLISLTKNSTDFLKKVNGEEIKVWGHGQKLLASGHSNGVD